MSLSQPSGANSARRISLLYASFSAVWIWFSDSALQTVFPDASNLIWLQSVKGSAFVLVTSLMLCHLIKHDTRVRGALTARLNLEAERLTHIMAVNPAVIYSLTAAPGANGGFVVNYASPKAQQVTGYSPAQWLATPGLWLARVHPDDRLKALQAQKQLCEKGVLRYEYRFLHADGSWRWIYERAIHLAPQP